VPIRPLLSGKVGRTAAVAREVRVAPRTPYSNDDQNPVIEAAVLFREAFPSSAPPAAGAG
jgi:hypothetical protein